MIFRKYLLCLSFIVCIAVNSSAQSTEEVKSMTENDTVDESDAPPEHAKLYIAIEHYLIAEMTALHPTQDYDFSVTVLPLDRRQTIADCDHEPEIKRINKTMIGRVSVKITCNSPTLWFLYGQASIEAFTLAVQSAHAIPQGKKLTPSDLVLVKQPLSSLNRGYFSKIENVSGYTVKKSLSANTLIIPQKLTSSKVIYKGDKVMIEAIRANIAVRMPGIALSDGYQGKQILVQNSQSSRTVKARVTGPGAVKVYF